MEDDIRSVYVRGWIEYDEALGESDEHVDIPKGMPRDINFTVLVNSDNEIEDIVDQDMG